MCCKRHFLFTKRSKYKITSLLNVFSTKIQFFSGFFLNSNTGLDLKPESENEFYKKEAKDMVNIIQRLLRDGKYFF